MEIIAVPEATPEYLVKVQELAERNTSVKNLINASNGYEHVSDKFKKLIHKIIKEREDGENTRDNT